MTHLWKHFRSCHNPFSMVFLTVTTVTVKKTSTEQLLKNSSKLITAPCSLASSCPARARQLLSRFSFQAVFCSFNCSSCVVTFCPLAVINRDYMRSGWSCHEWGKSLSHLLWIKYSSYKKVQFHRFIGPSQSVDNSLFTLVLKFCFYIQPRNI